MPFTIERNDLALVAADAIVIAANEQLQITGGVGMSVARAAGLDELQAACDAIGFCPCGSAVATPAFALEAKTVIHAVGPVWTDGNHGEAALLRSAYDAALECAVAHGARSVAFPLISAGTYGFPADVSLAVARESARAFLNRHDDVDARLVLYSRESVRAGMAAYLDIAEYIDDNYVEHSPYRSSVVLDAPFDPFEGVARQAASGAGAPSEPLPGKAQPWEVQPRGPRRKGRGGILARLGEAIEDAGSHRKRSRGERPDGASASGSIMAEAPVPAPDAAAATQAPVPALGADAAAAQAPDADAAVAPAAAPAAVPAPVAAQAAIPAEMSWAPQAAQRSLEELLDSIDAPFSTTLLALIDERGLTDAQVYKRANMSRQLFSKIRSDASYHPTKKTALALAVALGLSLDETDDLLARAGFTLSKSSKADVIVEYFIARRNYDIFEINEALYAFDQPLL